MKQASIKIKSYAGNLNAVNGGELSKRIFNIMLTSFGALALCYILLLGNMILNIVERKSLENRARALGSEVGDLELTYLSLSGKVDLNLAQSMGFKGIEAKFATRKSLGLAGSKVESLGNSKVVKNEL